MIKLSGRSLFLWRVYTVILGILDLSLMIIGYGIMWQGKMLEYRSQVLRYAIPIGILNFLFIWLGYGKVEGKYVKGFFVACAFFLFIWLYISRI